MFAPRIPAETIGRLWLMLGHQQGSMLNQARLASALGVSNPTIDRYIDLLVDLQLLRRLRPWSGNIGKRLIKTPKVYLRDSGILHGLLEIETQHDLLGHPVCGLSYEGYLQLRGHGLPRHGLAPCCLCAFTGALTPAETGVHLCAALDSGLRRNDGFGMLGCFTECFAFHAKCF
jgi:hypothetical protein